MEKGYAFVIPLNQKLVGGYSEAIIRATLDVEYLGNSQALTSVVDGIIEDMYPTPYGHYSNSALPEIDNIVHDYYIEVVNACNDIPNLLTVLRSHTLVAIPTISDNSVLLFKRLKD